MVSKDLSFITLPSPNNTTAQRAHSTPSSSSGPIANPGIMYHPSQMSGPHSPPPMNQGQAAGGLHNYPPPPQPEGTQEPQVSNQYPQYSYDIAIKYPQHPQHPQHPEHHSPQQQYNPNQGLPLPSMSTSGLPPISQGGYPPMPQQEMAIDTTGQVAPPGSKPRVTATLWEDEGTLCFQVDVKGTCVARREDNHMINGTKLLNVAGMTRGRRDGILKAEKQKHVVKIGPMHLKGVWIPFEKALEFANKEKITEALYPLFVHNIGALLYHPVNHASGRAYAPQPPPQQQGQQGGGYNGGQVGGQVGGQPPLQMMRPGEMAGQGQQGGPAPLRYEPSGEAPRHPEDQHPHQHPGQQQPQQQYQQQQRPLYS
ncbi:transcription regulator HTH, apses-type DNA-binding domain-containing protein [Halenospora varia]|nr:transcription regulator HTH, apses-type DNA-binding domain-containing protein [Halenospora varia]